MPLAGVATRPGAAAANSVGRFAAVESQTALALWSTSTLSPCDFSERGRKMLNPVVHSRGCGERVVSRFALRELILDDPYGSRAAAVSRVG
jgi:hypothetical protein